MATPKKVSTGPKKERRPPLTNEQVVEMISMWKDNSLDEIASKLGVSVLAINAAAKKVRDADSSLCPKKSKRMGFDVNAVLRMYKEKQS